jgi:hypothetical protein
VLSFVILADQAWRRDRNAIIPLGAKSYTAVKPAEQI